MGKQLGWQSRLLVAAVVPAAGLFAAARAIFRRAEGGRRTVAISLASAAGVWAVRAATPAAALAGGILASAMITGTATRSRSRNGAGAEGDASDGRQPPVSTPAKWTHTPLPPLLALILLTTAATRYKRERKQKPERSGRNAAQITANLGVAALSACLPAAWMRPHAAGPDTPAARQRTLAALVSTLSEATADTLSSELGEVLGGKPYLITSWRQAPAGTDGAVSFVGSVAGIAGAGAVVLSALPALCGRDPASGLVPSRVQIRQARKPALAAAAGAVAGLFFDSLLGATIEQRGWVNNDIVNFLSTLAAATSASILTR